MDTEDFKMELLHSSGDIPNNLLTSASILHLSGKIVNLEMIKKMLQSGIN